MGGREAAPELPHPRRRGLEELALALQQRFLGDVRRGLAEAELRLQRRPIIVGDRRIIVERLLALGGAALHALEIIVHGRVGLGQLLGVVRQQAVIIVDRAQIGRELALQCGDVEARAQVPEQVRAIFGRRCARDRQADDRVAAVDRTLLEGRVVDEQLGARRGRHGCRDHRRAGNLQPGLHRDTLSRRSAYIAPLPLS